MVFRSQTGQFAMIDPNTGVIVEEQARAERKDQRQGGRDYQPTAPEREAADLVGTFGNDEYGVFFRGQNLDLPRNAGTTGKGDVVVGHWD